MIYFYRRFDFSLINDWSQREQPLLIERSSPAPIAVRNEPPPDYYSEDDFLVV